MNLSLSIHILLVLFLWRLLTVYTRNTYLYLFIYLYIDNHEFMLTINSNWEKTLSFYILTSFFDREKPGSHDF